MNTVALAGSCSAERLERAARAAELRAAGLKNREVAAELGISIQYASALVRDPDGAKSRARKDRYRLPCPGCGCLMDGSNGITGAPRRCSRCEKADPSTRVWTRETVIAAFGAFAELAGRPPASTDAHAGSPSIAAHLSAERIQEALALTAIVALPTNETVRKIFGSWPDALRAAGMTPPRTGYPMHRRARRAPVREAPPASPNAALFDDVERLLGGFAE